MILKTSAVAAFLVPRDGYGDLTIDGYREIGLWKLIHAAQQVRLGFDPEVVHQGRPPDPDDGATKGRLVVGAHSLLNFLAVRHFHDQGFSPVVVSSTAPIALVGKRVVPRGVVASETLLPRIVRLLRGGEMICAMIDRNEAEKGTYRVETGIGPVHVADPLLRLAVKEQASITFCTFWVDGGRVRAAWASASATEGTEPVKAAFGAFLQDCIARGLGRSGPRAAALKRGRLMNKAAGELPNRSGAAAAPGRSDTASGSASGC